MASRAVARARPALQVYPASYQGRDQEHHMGLCLLTQGACPPENTTNQLCQTQLVTLGYSFFFIGVDRDLRRDWQKPAGLIWEEGWKEGDNLFFMLTILQGLSKSSISKVLKSLILYSKLTRTSIILFMLLIFFYFKMIWCVCVISSA